MVKEKINQQGFYRRLMVCVLVFLCLGYPAYISAGVLESEWVTTTPLLEGGVPDCVLTARGCIYTFNITHSVPETYEWSKISTDGSLGPWNIVSLSETLPWGVRGGAVSGNYLYLSGGQYLLSGNVYHYSEVYKATLLEGGGLSTFTSVAKLQTARAFHAMVSHNNYVYVVGGYGEYSGGNLPLNSVEFSLVNPDGTLAGWQYTASMNTISGPTLAWISDGYIWAYNGYVERAPINPDGTLGTWEYLGQPLPQESRLIYAGDKHLYIVRSDKTTLRVVPQVDGTLTDFQTLDTLSTCNASLASYQNYIYVLGGYCRLGPDETVVQYRKIDGLSAPLFPDLP